VRRNSIQTRFYRLLLVVDACQCDELISLMGGDETCLKNNLLYRQTSLYISTTVTFVIVTDLCFFGLDTFVLRVPARHITDYSCVILYSQRTNNPSARPFQLLMLFRKDADVFRYKQEQTRRTTTKQGASDAAIEHIKTCHAPEQEKNSIKKIVILNS
jgi:hypothetical protein